MSFELLLALAGFAIVTSVTPGPNNLMLLASGVNFGFRRSIPHMMGVGLGFAAMVVIVGLGLGQVFEAYPLAYTMLRYIGGAYMLWLAWKIANSGPIGDGTEKGKPFTYVQAALFQWVNPKAWVMAVTSIAAYTVPSAYVASVFTVGLVYVLVNVPSMSTWTLFGTGLRRFMSDPRQVRWFNIGMAVLLVVSLAPLLQGH
jgi:threonine/homoserine/homoserine lactone efflux protein